MYEKIKDSGIESSEPSFVLKAFDNAMQSASGVVEFSKSQTVSNDHCLTASENGLENGKIVLTNGINSDNLRDSLPLKDVKKNGGKIVNGFHKKTDVTSPTTVKDQLHMNGSGNQHQLERMNDSSKNRQKRKHCQLSEMPPIMIDTATRTMIAILGMNITNPNTAHSIRNDARVVLRRLIRGGKVSARTQLNFFPTGNTQIVSSSGFMHLLRSLELSRVEHENGEVWSAYTPFDLICDMFEYCGDISERQMVVSLRYTLFNTRPADVASYFVRNKNVSGNNSLRQLGSNLLLILKQDVSNIEKKTLLQHKMVVAAAALMIYDITKFSVGFNVALLRNAFETEFDAAEFQVLLRLTMEMLSNPDKFHLPTSSKTSMKNLLKLIVTLYDCIPAFKADSSAIDPTHMEHILSNLTAASGRMLSMQKLLQDTIDAISQNTESTQRQIETNQPANNVLDRPKQSPKPTTSLPPYQIERLLF